MENTLSVYERFAGTYIYDGGGQLVYCFGPSRDTLSSAWSRIRSQLSSSSSQNVSSETGQPLSRTVVTVEVGDDERSERLVMLQRRRRTSDTIGIALKLEPGSCPLADQDLDLFFASLILSGMHLDADGDVKESTPDRVTDLIVDLFDGALRYVAKDDMWLRGGREVFRDSVRHFTCRGQRVEFCLPAFPCKSSNPNKVQGTSPDRGELIALSNLHDFIQAIESIYPPGAKLWIISDGHVFSDCIGVDDAVVDGYGAQLIAMNEDIASSRGGVDRIGFKSLVDIFAPDRCVLDRRDCMLDRIPCIQHDIQTKQTTEAETCRRILRLGFQLHDSALRESIDNQDKGILALYRGFSKFMLEDLELNPYTNGLSQSKRRKLAAKVAFEMIQRNQAYSNLVEIIFPHHVRLSIHAYDLASLRMPSPEVHMLGKGVRAAKELLPDADLALFHDQLHVPTPWHNCIVDIEGHPTLYLTKSSVARAALSTGTFVGRWAGHSPLMGACFSLSPAIPLRTAPATQPPHAIRVPEHV
ncbi:Pyoverdine biosynthesis [Drechmeria coniospora]|uniref:Pyoverdine biosynthesis n=1 Tax=Drechmeria coniospora TaxID=98403 RepID=A0A151GJ39_DRECN|nr:Pyoverdine biosynthesis [Drechmeria coniospora]KYK57098.1 Pyoverdine biosynthesis [Drechmeria coniospora]